MHLLLVLCFYAWSLEHERKHLSDDALLLVTKEPEHGDELPRHLPLQIVLPPVLPFLHDSPLRV